MNCKYYSAVYAGTRT